MAKIQPIQVRLDLWPRQLEALESEGTEILFGGATSGGKSHFARVALIVYCLGVPGIQCVLIRKKFDDILKNHVDGPTGFRAMLAPLLEHKRVEVTQKGVKFDNGSAISFQHCQDERQFDSAQGVEKHVLVIDEATQISERLIKFFRVWCRMSEEMQAKLPESWRGKFPKILYTANPIGVSVGWFRRNFILPRKPFEIERVGGFKRQFIPSRAEDNLSTDMDALEGRMADLGDLGRVLRDGDWLGVLGDFYKEYNDELHSVPDHKVPGHWFKYRTFDWGSADPFAAYWFAVSDGERYRPDGVLDPMGRIWYPRGALLVYREWYGGRVDNPARGLHMRNEEIAKGILSRTEETTCGVTFTDSFPFADRGASKDGEKYTMADTFREQGCPLTLGNTARVYGWKQLRSRLQGVSGVPMIYFFRSCKYARDYIPALGHHETKPEDAVEDGEATHACDALRLGAVVKPFTWDMPIAESGFDISREDMSYDAVIDRIVEAKERYFEQW